MIPIRDTIPARLFPVINITLIIVNVLIFFYEVSLGPSALEQFISTYGLVPARFWPGEGPAQWLPLFTSIFLHGGWLHLLSNMLALYIFGDNIEDRLGHGRYLIFYLAGGLIAGATHLLIYPSSPVPTIGASGAIAAVLGAYIVLYPHARVLTLILLPFFFIFPIVEIPAIFYLGFWFLSQILNGLFTLGTDTFQGGGVAWWAHIGGFLAGLIIIWIFAPRRPQPYHRDEYYPW